MIEIAHSDIGSVLEVKTDNKNFSSQIVKIPFYDPKKNIAKG